MESRGIKVGEYVPSDQCQCKDCTKQESRFDFWMRQTLREKPAQILGDWSIERKELIEALQFISSQKDVHYGMGDKDALDFKVRRIISMADEALEAIGWHNGQ